ncbi:MAG: transglutaminase TgpA family protein [Thermomicrobiales bacterium]
MHFLIVLVAARTIEREDWADGLTVLTPVAGLALLNGIALAKSRAPDLVAHTLSFVLGLALAVALTASTLDGSMGWRQRLEFLWDRAALWFRRAEAGRRIDDADLFVLMMAFTVWLVAYSSSWMLYRRRWLVAAAILPGMVIVINLGYATGSSSMPLVIYTLGALVLAARHFVFRRQVEWSRTRLPSPERLPWHFARSGLSIALVVVLLGWTVPTDAARPLVERLADRLEGPLDAVEDRWHDLMTPLNGDSPSGGSFASFGDSFRLGGELNLSDEPVAIVQAGAPVYLTALHYNRYNGHGWSTDIEETFRTRGDDGEVRAPLITFEPESSVFLSSDMTGDRSRQTAQIVVLRPKGDLLFSIYTYETSSEKASVQLSWRQLNDARFDVQGTDLGAQPEDLRQLISLLRGAEYESGVSENDQRISDPALAAQIVAMQVVLREDRFLDTRWTIGDDGRVETLIVTGQLPIYDDVEAVRADEPPARGDLYEVTGLESDASPRDLRQAGTDNPDFIDARYTMLPTTVTEQTVALTQEVTAGTDNRYDQALAIQSFLRTSFAYDEKVEVPPDNRDVVDFFLFESQRGYCEYFASAMVVMLRSLDIPSRIAAGYRSVPFDDSEGGYLYREKQAHTWVEVYFPEFGWIPFEPTPAAEPFQHGDEQEPPREAIPPATVEPVPTPTVLPTPTPAPVATPGAVAGTEQPRASDDGMGRFTDEFVWGLGGFAVFAVGGATVASTIWLWGFRGLSPIGALYARVQRIGRWWGLRPDPSLTPVEYARELGQVAPTMRSPARLLAQLYEVEQYGARPVTPVDTATGQSAWKDLRGAVLRNWKRRRRKREKSVES